MNTRCYRCGWNFSLRGETLEEAAVSSAGQTAHVIHCPRCRQAIRIPMDQIMRALPPGWKHPTPEGALAGVAPEASAPDGVETAAVAAANPQAPIEAADTAVQPQRRRHRRSGKTNSGDSAAVPAAKNSNHPH